MNMQKFWQSIKASPFSPPEDRQRSKRAPGSAGVTSGPTVWQDTQCARIQRTDPSCQISPLAAPTTPPNEIGTGADFPVALQTHHDHHPLFRPGWTFDNSTDADGLCEAASITRDQRGKSRPNCLRAAVGGTNAESGRRTTSVPEGDANQCYDRTKHELKERAPRLRTVASSPSLSNRDDSKTALLPPQDRLTFATRTGSDDRQSLNTTLSPLPRPPMNKPLPPVPTVRPHATVRLPPSTGQIPEYQYFERARAPPTYAEAQVPSTLEIAASDGETVSARTRTVMEVLGHMVALLKIRDDASLMEFSNLVTTQARFMYSGPEGAAQNPNTA